MLSNTFVFNQYEPHKLYHNKCQSISNVNNSIDGKK